MPSSLFETPGEMTDLRRVGDLGRRAAPEVPIERRRRVLDGGVTQARQVMNLGVYLHDSSEIPLLEIVTDLLNGRTLVPLKANLDNDVLFLCRRDHRLRLADVIGERFLTVDIQILLDRRQEGQGMPVRRRGDNDRLEARRRQEFLIVLERPRPRALHLLNGRGGLHQVLTVHVTHGAHFHAAHLERRPHIGHPVVAAADHAKLEFRLPRRGRGRSRLPAASASGRRAAHEVPSIHLLHSMPPFPSVPTAGPISFVPFRIAAAVRPVPRGRARQCRIM